MVLLASLPAMRFHPLSASFCPDCLPATAVPAVCFCGSDRSTVCQLTFGSSAARPSALLPCLWLAESATAAEQGAKAETEGETETEAESENVKETGAGIGIRNYHFLHQKTKIRSRNKSAPEPCTTKRPCMVLWWICTTKRVCRHRSYVMCMLVKVGKTKQ